MNKTLKLVLCLVLVLSSVLCFAACGDDKDDKKSDSGNNTPVVNNPVSNTPVVTPPVTSSMAGHYSLYSMTMDGTTLTGADLVAAMANIGYSDPDQCMSMTLNADGTGTMVNEGVASSIGYDNSKMWPTEDPTDVLAFTFDGTYLTLNIEGSIFIYQKN